MNFPSKPWTNGQTAELVSGTTFVYDSSKGAWLVQTGAKESEIISMLDSDTAYL